VPPEPGIYVTFFNEGEAFDRELPPVGPLIHVVLRHKDLVAERPLVHQPDVGSVSIDRWLEAELEYQRATGQEPGGQRRTNLRLTAPDGLYLRFATFGDEREANPMREIGPFAVIFVGRRSIEADGKILATRQASELAPWDLTSAVGDQHAGMRKPDIAFRTVGMPFHPSVGQGPERAQPQLFEPAPVVAPTPPAAPEPAIVPPSPPTYAPPTPADTPPAPGPEQQALTENDQELIKRIERERAEDVLRARLQEEERRRLGVDDSAEGASTWAMRYRPTTAEGAVAVAAGGGFSVGRLLWQLRFALIGVLLLSIGVYGFMVVRTGAAPGAQSQVRVAGIAEKISGTRWDYVVNSVQRMQSIGTSRPRGAYLVVRVGVTNKSGATTTISPGEFGLVDASGTAYAPESAASPVYSGTQLVWPQQIPDKSTVTLPLVFDIDPALKGVQLTIAELPKVRVRLPD